MLPVRGQCDGDDAEAGEDGLENQLDGAHLEGIDPGEASGDGAHGGSADAHGHRQPEGDTAADGNEPASIAADRWVVAAVLLPLLHGRSKGHRRAAVQPWPDRRRQILLPSCTGITADSPYRAGPH